jgi:hypothetical protein
MSKETSAIIFWASYDPVIHQETEENDKNLYLQPILDLNLGSLEYEAELLIMQPQCLVGRILRVQ